MLQLLAQIDPQKAMHDAWQAQSPEVHIGTTGTGFGALLAGVDWYAAVAFVCAVTPLVLGMVVQCWKQMKLAEIDIDRARRKAERDDAVTAAPARP